MTHAHALARHSFIVAIAGTALIRPGWAADGLPTITVHRDPNCGSWVAHLKAEGFPVDLVETAEVNRVKARLGVPPSLAACHTAEVAGYVVEGYVHKVEAQHPHPQRPVAPGQHG